ncbi:MAG: High-affnity carbon uptake protein Hat/HatR [Cyclobacteriaceae bacterium]
MLKQPLDTGDLDIPLPEPPVAMELQGGNPFPGLRPFTLDECHLFFGREGQADEILLKLSLNRFVTVMGYSGSGKSSLMYCGLVPVLYGGFMTQTGPNWNAVVTRPGSSPMNNLAESIVDNLVSNHRVEEADRNIQEAIINSVLRSGPLGLIEVSKYLQNQTGENIFFLVDQFEELLRFREKSEFIDAHNEAQLYVNLVLNAVAQTAVPVYVALTMRSDFIGNCSVFPRLTDHINRSNYLVPQMTREQKKMVIEGPVSVAGGRISQRLVKRLLSDVGNDQDQLPILQHALMRTWDYWVTNREGEEPLDIRHYNAVGRIHEALSQHANEAYDELTTREKEIAEVLFKTITEKNHDNKGMRRPGRLGLVAQLAEAEEEDVVYVVDHFRRSGRSLLMPGMNVPLNADSMIELSHESLMRIWKRLNTWVEDEFESALMYKRLSDAAAMYQIGKTGLWRPPDLQLALNWQKKQKPTWEWAQRYDDAFERAIVFLDTSRITYEAELKNQEMMQRRVLQRTRATAVFLGAGFVVAVVFFLLSYIQMMRADTQAELAETRRLEAVEQSRIAEENRVQAEENYTRAEENYDSLQKTTVALGNALTQAEEQRLRTVEALELANTERENALKQTEIANEARKQIGVQLSIAEAARNDARRQYILAVAQSLAAKSVQENDDSDLAGLLAMQGYHFHRRHDGRVYDPYIYEGLYSSLTKVNGLAYNAIKAQGPPHVHIKSLVLSNQDNAFYTSGADGRIMKGSFAQLTSSATPFSNPYPSRVIATSNDETYIVNGSDSAFVQIYNLKDNSPRPSAVARGLQGSTNDIVFIPGQQAFIVSSSGKTLTRIDAVTVARTVLVTLPFELKAIDISPDGKTLAGASWSGQVVLVNLRNNTYEVLVEENKSRMLTVRFTPKGDGLAYGGEDKENKRGFVRLYDFNTKETRHFSGHRAGVNDIEFSPDGGLMASAGADKRLLMWVLENPGDLPITMQNNAGFVWDIAFTKNSDYLIAACSESEIRVWPTNPSLLAEKICPQLKRNMTKDEWVKYVGREDDISYESTCVGLLINDF